MSSPVFFINQSNIFMKITFSVLFATVISLIAFNGQAQIKEGQVMLGANLSYSNTNTDYTATNVDANYKLNEVKISPQVGIGIGSNLVVGVMVGYGYAKQKATGTSGNEYEGKSYAAGAFVRNFHPLVEKFGIYGQANFEYGWSRYTSPINNDKTKILAAYLQPGFYFTPGKKIILETTFGRIGYSNRKTKSEYTTPRSETDENKFDVSITDGLSIGIKFIL